MLYFIFTIDGDWGSYFDIKLEDSERFPKINILQDLIQHEIDMADRILRGRFIHFIHTSPRVRDFFLEKDFRMLWKDIMKNKGDVGLHCHEDDPYREYYYHDGSRMRNIISERCKTFKKVGCCVRCYRSGFLGFSVDMVRILEDNGLFFDFSCEPGRFLEHHGQLICDWRSAPEYHYKMSYSDHCKQGDSKVWEIPVGVSRNSYLYFEKSSLKDIKKIALDLKEKSMQNRCDIVVSVLTHSYEYESKECIKDIELKLNLLKKYGSFINLEELGNILP